MILVIDDTPSNLRLLSDYLSDMGFTVLLKKGGASALTLLDKQLPDIILLDILMPDMDGFDVCRRLKADNRAKDIPVIFMSALTDTLDKIKGFDVGGVDYITKPFRQEEVLARVKAHLTIVHQQKQLQKLNAAKDKFFSIIAHDLRGPLSTLRTINQHAAERLKNDDPEKLKEIIELQQTSTDRLFTLLDNLLTWSRIQRGMMEYCPQAIEIGTIITQNLALFAPNAEHKQIRLNNSIQEKMMAYADLRMLDTIVRNLVANALKFTKTHGTVTVSATQNEREIEVSVSDTGIGIAQEHLPKLFRIDIKYKRLGTAREQGTGLGLVLCKEFVEQHGGRIRVASEPGKGTTFSFSVPRAGDSELQVS